MSLIKIEGFEGFTGGDSTALLNGNLVEASSAFTNGSLSTDTPWGYGRSYLQWGGNKYRDSIANRTKVYQGVAVKRTFFSNSNAESIFEVFDGSTMQCWVGWDSTNRQYRAYRGSGTSNLLGSSALYATPDANTWHYAEWCPVIHSSTGSIEVRIEGQTILNLTNVNTQASGSAQITVAALVAHGDNERMACDDYYLFDDQGSANNTFNGPCRIYTLKPSSDDSVQWTRNTGSTNASAVDDFGDIDDDTTYNADATVGHKDSLNMEDVPSTATVKGFEVRIAAKKDDATARTIRSFIERAGNTTNQTTRTLLSSYALWVDRYENDPTDASAIDATKINAMHIGYEVVS